MPTSSKRMSVVDFKQQPMAFYENEIFKINSFKKNLTEIIEKIKKLTVSLFFLNNLPNLALKHPDV